MGVTMQNHILYDDGYHKCIAFSMPAEDEIVPSNQFLVIDGQEAALIDPGGDLTFSPLTMQLTKFLPIEQIKYVIGSHQDPDIIASMPRWLLHTPQAHLIISALWERFLPHYNSSFTKGRLKKNISEYLITIPDMGGKYPLGDNNIIAIPAHFLHSVGNFQFYDPVSKILFSGDMGASLVGNSGQAVANFPAHIAKMEDFHKRYMSSQIATRAWAKSIQYLDMEKMVPQHGCRFDGKPMIGQFIKWIANLPCGVDLIDDTTYDFSHLI